jgi:hypothetical protein
MLRTPRGLKIEAFCLLAGHQQGISLYDIPQRAIFRRPLVVD